MTKLTKEKMEMHANNKHSCENIPVMFIWPKKTVETNFRPAQIQLYGEGDVLIPYFLWKKEC